MAGNKDRDERQKQSDHFMQVVGDLSKELEKHSAVRVAEAKRNEMLKEALRRGFERYQKTEEDFNKKMQECELALASFQKSRSAPKKKKKATAPSSDVPEAAGVDSAAVPQESRDNLEEERAANDSTGGPSEDRVQPPANSDCDDDEDAEEEDEEFKAEMEAEKARTEAAKQKIMTQIVAEKELRAQLAEYADHFERFQV